ncbi:iron ABC transporter permease [Ruegeria marisrubri]|uniref:Iron ABC transporter permease n=1 Tax=Ruegeria marisrubri TaxID=1685379 RepID=A0A124F5S6_9RHOB|nr:lipocalin-like domain-containing protein [Ruegeria marisrubri]KUJ86159.1 iron ABC transporter permease [Ruegeria marisrubri]
MSVRFLPLFLFLPFSVLAQGFAGLGTDAEGYETPRPGYEFQFPADHGAHPAFRIEWWYVTATLTGDDGESYGIQWTLFRSALKPFERQGWQNPQLWIGHAAVTTAEHHRFAERIARGGIGQAGVIATPFSAWIDDWEMAGPDMETLSLSARGADFSYEMNLKAQGPLVFHGDRGFSVKSADGQASYYYSQPAYAVTGSLRLPEGDVQVTGQAWMDREWSSQPLSKDQTGWDWFSLNFDSGARLMAFRLRGARGDFTSATWIAPDGTTRSIPDGLVETAPLETARVAGREIPVRWRLKLPAENLDIEVSALNPDAWMETSFPYWEGPVTVAGTHQGRGYLEMTGYE